MMMSVRKYYSVFTSGAWCGRFAGCRLYHLLLFHWLKHGFFAFSLTLSKAFCLGVNWFCADVDCDSLDWQVSREADAIPLITDQMTVLKSGHFQARAKAGVES